ncbi:hypothetical protein [Blastococcus goldschmidtiae]|uniref:Blue (type 1) copper domain-containing protein n=1 Tax=Blastococcus goldschmidtiae TaxID=3075546 RepID=A0ABU2K9U9_9ACTN|nr:hypothetical protein [Blastococcus sp. DSM 46792]MDT0276961.1 hypothetical protein [Blastococcus sp. DSM 46792]
MTGRMGLRRWSTGGAALLMAAALAACGTDDDGGEDTTAAGSTETTENTETTESTETTGTTESGSGDVDAFCSAVVDVETLSSQGPPVDPETAPPEELEAAMLEFSEQLEPSLEEAEETAPEEVSEDVDTLVSQIRQVLETGDDSMLISEEFLTADAAVDEYMIDNCGYEQIEATGVDYEYEGLPDTVPAGTVAVTFNNEGEEVHEIGLVRINEGVTQSIEELLALPEEEAMSMATFVGVAFADPGQSDTTFMEMEPGRYAAVCFVPEGTTHIDMPGEGAPHFTLGMVGEFTVE